MSSKKIKLKFAFQVEMDVLSVNVVASYLKLRHIAHPENIDKQGNCTGPDDCIDWRITFCTHKALIRAGKISRLQ
jgi:hypothetical protein